MRSFLLLSISLALASGLGCTGNQGQTQITLGHVANFSGPIRSDADHAAQGIRLAIEELGTDPLPGLGKRPLVVRHADARGLIEAYESQAVRLATVNRAVALLGGTTEAEVQKMEQARVPLITWTANAYPGMSDYVFRGGIPAEQRGAALAQYLLEEKKVATVTALADRNQADFQEFWEAFQKEWTDSAKRLNVKAPDPGKPIYFEKMPTPETIQKLPTEAVVFLGGPEAFTALAEGLPQGKGLLVHGGEDASLGGRISAKRPVIVATPFVVDPTLPETERFAKHYREQFRSEPTARAALAYDNLRLVVAALQKTQPINPDRLRDELFRFKDFTGLTGPIVITPDRRLLRPIFVGVKIDDRWENVRRHQPPQ